MNPSICPTCTSPAIPVVWGKPGAATLRAAEHGLVRPGGCIVRGSPHETWWCSSCEASLLGPATGPAIAAALEELRSLEADPGKASS